MRLRTFSPVASSSCLARSAKPSAAHPGELLECLLQLAARVQAAAFAAQPLAVHQPGPGQLEPQPGPAEPVDGLGVGPVGLVSGADEGS
ncbi:hypothetical protein [Nonomuraea insulae]|uniref:Secreted protein n=1 Tax=Nonomuraea insulae TaxID=1616787 RepID=A0ABW1DBB3_9ACTN